jgi:hypothetical protein
MNINMTDDEIMEELMQGSPLIVLNPSTQGDDIERMIQAKGLTAPRVTPADIEANISSEHYFTAGQGDRKALDEAATGPCVRKTPEALDLLTFCVLVLKNGFTVTGESACASPENFDAEVGQAAARKDAISKLWPLMGYALKEKLSQA